MKNTKSKNKEAVTNLSRYEWAWYAKSYLSLARIGINELEAQNYVRKRSFEYSFSYEYKHLLIPIIYNLKHSIEIIVKALNIGINKKFTPLHDSVYLNEVLQKSIKKEGMGIQENKLDELGQIIEKYYKLEFWGRKLIATASILDSQNDIFRFPDNSANFILDLKTFKDVSRKETQELLDDIKKLNNLLVIIMRGIQKAKNPELYRRDGWSDNDDD